MYPLPVILRREVPLTGTAFEEGQAAPLLAPSSRTSDVCVLFGRLGGCAVNVSLPSITSAAQHFLDDLKCDLILHCLFHASIKPFSLKTPFLLTVALLSLLTLHATVV